ncbi:hypothetical protein IL306_009909 [Fusarium sp. DS 682]|nr:hypothetical protein IL306_009909 [Fusarium sp. DS 682]
MCPPFTSKKKPQYDANKEYYPPSGWGTSGLEKWSPEKHERVRRETLQNLRKNPPKVQRPKPLTKNGFPF